MHETCHISELLQISIISSGIFQPTFILTWSIDKELIREQRMGELGRVSCQIVGPTTTKLP